MRERGREEREREGKRRERDGKDSELRLKFSFRLKGGNDSETVEKKNSRTKLKKNQKARFIFS